MKNYILIFSLFLFHNSSIYCQSGNLVPNSSFENGDNNRPNSDNDIPNCDFWKKHLNTADWYKEESGLFQSDFVDAHTGTGYIGFAPCEGVKIQLEQDIKHMKYVVISLWFSPQTLENSEILVSLSKGNPGSSSVLLGYECSVNGPFLSTDFQLTVSVDSQEHQVGEWYYYESEPILVTYEGYNAYGDPFCNDCYNWLVISGKDDHENSGGEYVYIDDVSVIQFDGCEHVCATSEGPHRISSNLDTYLYNSDDESDLGANGHVRTYVHTGTTSDFDAFDYGTYEEVESSDVVTGCIPNNPHNYQYLIENAVKIHFTVLNSSGALIYFQEIYDYNGLHDEINGIIYPDYLFVWNGQNTISVNTYTTLLYIEFCGGRDIAIDAGVYVEYNDGTIISDLSGLDIRIDEIENCCEDNYKIQNVTYTAENTYRNDADDYIRAGENITSTVASGPVHVSLGAKVSYYAGNNIFLEPGFSADGEFNAEIHNCGSAPKSYGTIKGDSRKRTLPFREAKESIGKRPTNHIKVYPNPATNKLFFDSGDEIIDIEIYSLDGKLLIQEINLNKVSYQLDVSQLKGSYIVKYRTLTTNFTKLIVVE